MRRGPYVNEHEGEVYLPVADWTYNEARSEAAEFAEEMHGDWGRSHYDGKRDIELHDCEDWEGGDCESCPPELAWCFTTYEGTYRR